MRLRYVAIKNFRSIADVRINLEPRCRVLVGINEAGKTNILKALSLLDPATPFQPLDLREPRPGEEYDQESYVRFVFVFDENDRTEIYSLADVHLFYIEPDPPLMISQKQSFSVSQFLEKRNEILYVANLKTKKRYFTSWALSASYKLAPGWKKASANCPADLMVTLATGEEAKLSAGDVIYVHDFQTIPEEYLIDADPRDVMSILDGAAKEWATPNLPACVFWTYSEKYLLPGQISLGEFISNPDSCIPLKHMFLLAGISDISADLTQAQNRSNGIRNILKRVSELSTKHMHSVWKEYKGVSISLQQNGDFIDAVIQDKHNTYNMERRSDGFKRFITFLFLVSAKVETDDLANTLYLQDEPEMSLHPRGAKHLREELIRISEKNYVVYATHSIFMIDPNLPERHFIVEKVDEVTTIKEVSESDVVDEEVIYNALDYSIFQNLSHENIICEGWRDKKLLMVALSKIPAGYKKTLKSYASIGKCHAKGVKDISRIASMLELGDRRFVVLSDGDATAKERQAEYRKEFPRGCPWLRYDELTIDAVVVTAEDFIKPEAFLPAIESLRAENPGLPPLTVEQLVDPSGRLAAITAWLTSNGIERDMAKGAINTIKEVVFNDLAPSQLLPAYYEVLVAVTPYFSPETIIN